MGIGDAETLTSQSGDALAADAELPIVDPSCYELGAELARGGFGRLIRARDRRLDRVVAIKQMSAISAKHEARFRIEARLTARLHHPAIVPVHEVGRWPSGEPFYAMRLVTGRSLAAVLDATPALVDRLALLPQVTTVVEAIAYAHREHVLHRDLKPSNIMLGESSEAYVVDWGLAKELRGDDVAPATTEEIEDPLLTSAGAVLGTPPYLSPEQARGDAVDERADVYSLGALLYELVTGVRPYSGNSTEVLSAIAAGPPPPIEARQPAVPRELAAIIDRAMARAPADRYPTANGLADDLRHFARGELVSAYRYSPAQRAARWVRRRRTVVLIGALVAATAIAIAWPRSASPEWRPVIRELMAYEEDATYSAFSPDGKLLAIDSDRDGQYRIYVGAPPLADPRPITPRSVVAKAPQFGRDGRSLMYRNADGIFRMPVDGGPATLIVAGALAWAECGDAIAFVHESSAACALCFELALRDPSGHDRTVVRAPIGEGFGQITCDREGRHLAYALLEKLQPLSQEQSLWLVDVTGGAPRKLLDVSAHVQGLRFHPDGKSVLVSSDRGGARNIWDVPIDGGEPTQVTFGAGPDHSPTVSPDGSELLFHVDMTSTALFAVPIDGGQPRRLTTALENVDSPAVSPDGRLLAFAVDHGASSTIEVMTLATGEVRTIGDGRFPQFSRDGRELLFARGDELVAMPLDGAPRSLGHMAAQIQGFIQDLPQGTHLMILGRHGLETWLRAPDGTLSRIPQVGDWLELGVLPNGWRVASSDETTFALIPPGGRMGDPAYPARTGRAAGWVADPLQFVYLVGDELWSHDFTADRDERVIALLHPRELAMSPDGKTIYVTREVGRVRRDIITNFGDRPRPR